MTIDIFKKYSNNNKKISVITAYDYTSAKIISKSNIDSILVGDSLAMLICGENSTINTNIEDISYHTKAVSKGAPNKFIIADMPFLSYKKGLLDTMNNVEKLMKSGANAIKIENVYGHEDLISHIIKSDIPVMGHIGLTPQSINKLGGYKIQGKTDKQIENLFDQAKKLEQLGCFAIVIECVPNKIAANITNNINIPTIGIGAGPYTDGQVLTWHDLLGLTDYENINKKTNFKPRFIKEYLNSRDLILNSLNQFDQDINNKIFPDKEHCY